MSHSEKKLLIIVRNSPYGDNKNRESIDIALASGSFEQPTCLLFLGDGVFHFCQGQNPALRGLKDLSKTLKMLPLYGLDQLYYQAQDIEQRGLDKPELAQALDHSAIKTLIAQHEVVISL